MIILNSLMNKELSNEKIMSLNSDEILFLVSPSTFSNRLHETNRVLIFDSICKSLIRYYNKNEFENGYYIVCRNDIVPKPEKSKTPLNNVGKRYSYHGGYFGIFDGYFSSSDSYFRFRKINGKPEISDSIPNWNLPHFFCDYIRTDDDSKSFVEWVFGSEANAREARLLLGIVYGIGETVGSV